MKGVIFNLFEDFVTQTAGDDAWDQLLVSCGLDTKEPYIGPATYADAELSLLVKTFCDRQKVAIVDGLRAFGRHAFGPLAKRYPAFLAPFTHPKPFLMSVHGVVHVQVKSLMRDSVTPQFAYEDPGENALIVRYSSDRKLCAFFEGLAQGACDFYGTAIEFDKRSCMHRGDSCCEYLLTFKP